METTEEHQCAICLSEIKATGKAVIRHPCGHSFHFDCEKKNASGRCPVCRANTRPTVGLPDPGRDRSSSSLFAEMKCVIAPEFPVVSTDATELLALLTVKAPDVVVRENRQHAGLDLVAVVDVSYSMQGDEKIEKVRTALKFVISELSSADRLAIITFSKRATKLSDFRLMTDAAKEEVTSLVETVTTAGGTSIISGFDLAVDALQQRRQRNVVSAILLFTDGQDNKLSAESLAANVAAGYGDRALDASLCTFGFGVDHDAAALAGMARAGHGTFCYLRDAEAVSPAVGACLGGLLTVFAKHIEIVIETKCGVLIDGKLEKKTIEINDMFHGERRDVLLSLQLPAGTEFAHPGPVIASVAYDVPMPPAHRDLINFPPLEVQRVAPASVAAARGTPNAELDVQRNRETAAKALLVAADAACRQRLEAARDILTIAKNKIEKSATGNRPQCAALMSDLARAIEGVRSAADFAAGGEQDMRSVQMSHASQRGSVVGDSYMTPSQSEEACSSVIFAGMTTRMNDEARNVRRRVDVGK